MPGRYVSGLRAVVGNPSGVRASNAKGTCVKGTFTPTADFFRIDTALRVPVIDVDTWSLTITGMVDRLAARLADNPRDEAGWLRLIRARAVLGDTAATAKARDDALTAFNGDAAAAARIRPASTEAGV